MLVKADKTPNSRVNMSSIGILKAVFQDRLEMRPRLRLVELVLAEIGMDALTPEQGKESNDDLGLMMITRRKEEWGYSFHHYSTTNREQRICLQEENSP